MIKNVNLLQNPIEYDRYSEEFIIQALANLGQRVGIKGDGIAYKFFTFNDLIDNNDNSKLNELSNVKNVGYIQYIRSDETSNYIAKVGVKQIDNDTGEFINDIVISTSKNVNNILYFNKDLFFDIPIGGIEKYSKNSICINDGNELTFMLAGKILGSEDNDDYNTILYYYKFDINTNMLKYASKIFQYDSSIEGERVALISIVNSLYKENGYTGNSLNDNYIMSFNILNLNNIENLGQNGKTLKQSFKNIFKFSNYSSTNYIPFSLLRPEYVDVNELYNYYEDSLKNYDNNSPIAVICNLLNNITVNEKTLNLTYNTNNNELIALEQDTYEYVSNYLKNEYKLNIDEELLYINEDINTLYYNIFSYYDDQYFLSSRKAFIQSILIKIYEKLLNITNNVSYQDSTLYIPLDYRFNYICNSNNEIYIYYSINTYVSCLNLSTINDKQYFWESNDNLIYDYNLELNKVIAFNFEINYNNTNDKLINSIDIATVFTLPYINANNNWSINDYDTNIKAIGKNAGNPNIIIIYNYDEKSYEVLNTVSNSYNIKNCEFDLEYFNIDNALFENIDDGNIQCCAYLPTVTDSNFEYFENSIILSISDLNCLSNQNYKYNYKGNYIFTIWHLIEDENGNVFYKYINQPNESNDYALVLGTSTNLLNSTNDTSIANLNEQDLIILKAIITEVAQDRLTLNANNWIIFKNKQSEEYLDDNNTQISNYKNDLNAIIQFNDKIDIVNNHAIYSQTNKYITNLNNIAVTNSLYPQYNVDIQTVNTKATQLALREIDALINSRTTSIIINGERVSSVEEYVQYIQKQLREEEISLDETLEIVQISKGTSNYNEFIFNENIPTLDFAELFNRNFNVLNRVNIVSLDETGKTYNAYIGTSFDDNNKSVLHIGTTNTNINIGHSTLLDYSQFDKFNTHDTLSLDFDNIILNNQSLVKKCETVTQKIINGVTYNYCTLNIIESTQSLNLSNNSVIINDQIIDSIEIESTISPYKINLNNLFNQYLNKKILVEYNENDLNVHLNIPNINEQNSISQYPIQYYVDQSNNIFLILEPSLIKSYNVIDNGDSRILYLPNFLNIMYYNNISDSKLHIIITSNN